MQVLPPYYDPERGILPSTPVPASPGRFRTFALAGLPPQLPTWPCRPLPLHPGADSQPTYQRDAGLGNAGSDKQEDSEDVTTIPGTDADIQVITVDQSDGAHQQADRSETAIDTTVSVNADLMQPALQADAFSDVKAYDIALSTEEETEGCTQGIQRDALPQQASEPLVGSGNVAADKAKEDEEQGLEASVLDIEGAPIEGYRDKGESASPQGTWQRESNSGAEGSAFSAAKADAAEAAKVGTTQLPVHAPLGVQAALNQDMGTGPGPPTATSSVNTGAVISHNAALAQPSTPLTSLPGPRLDVVGGLLTLPTIRVPAALQQPQSIDAKILQHMDMELPVAPSSPRCVEDAHVQGMQQDIQQPAMLTSEAREDNDVPQGTIGPEVYRAASLLQELVLEPETPCEDSPHTGMDVASSALEEGLEANIQGCEAGSSGLVTLRHMNGMPASNAKSQLPLQPPSADNVPHLSPVLSATDLAKVGCIEDGTANRPGHGYRNCSQTRPFDNENAHCVHICG